MVDHSTQTASDAKDFLVPFLTDGVATEQLVDAYLDHRETLGQTNGAPVDSFSACHEFQEGVSALVDAAMIFRDETQEAFSMLEKKMLSAQKIIAAAEKRHQAALTEEREARQHLLSAEQFKREADLRMKAARALNEEAIAAFKKARATEDKAKARIRAADRLEKFSFEYLSAAEKRKDARHREKYGATEPLQVGVDEDLAIPRGLWPILTSENDVESLSEGDRRISHYLVTRLQSADTTRRFAANSTETSRRKGRPLPQIPSDGAEEFERAFANVYLSSPLAEQNPNPACQSRQDRYAALIAKIPSAAFKSSPSKTSSAGQTHSVERTVIRHNTMRESRNPATTIANSASRITADASSGPTGTSSYTTTTEGLFDPFTDIAGNQGSLNFIRYDRSRLDEMSLPTPKTPVTPTARSRHPKTLWRSRGRVFRPQRSSAAQTSPSLEPTLAPVDMHMRKFRKRGWLPGPLPDNAAAIYIESEGLELPSDLPEGYYLRRPFTYRV